MTSAPAFANAVGSAIEIVGILVVVLGGMFASVAVIVRRARYRDAQALFEAYRGLLGRAILLGLEFLVAADIVKTVATTPTFESLGILAGIVLIRTFLSLSLGVEIEGRFPWQPRRGDAPDDRVPPGG